MLGAVLRVAPALLPDSFVQKIVIDDSMYYLEVARNLAADGRSTFDGLSPANGYHPLWMAMLIPLGWLEPTTLVLRLVITATATLSVAAFVVLARTLRGLAGDPASLVGLSIWWLGPLAIGSSLSGTESAIATLMFAFALSLSLTSGDELSNRDAVLIGLACGLMLLARTDTFFAVGGIFVWLAVRLRTSRLSLRRLVIAVLAALIVTVPWLAWNLSRFGTVTQSSAYVVPVAHWERYRLNNGNADIASQIGHGLGTALDYISQVWPGQLIGSRNVLMALVALLAIGWIATRPWGYAANRVASLGLVTLAGATLLAAFHAGVRLFPRDYYFDWGRVALAVCVAGCLAGILAPGLIDRPSRQRTARAVVVLTLSTVMVWQGGSALRGIATPGLKWQPSMVEAAAWLDANLESDAKVLSFNAGYIGYFSDRTVINVDGAINTSAAKAILEDDLAAYLCETGAEWFVDFDPTARDAWSVRYGPDADRLVFEPVATIRAPGTDRFNGSELVISRFSCVP